jgi:hypothetical protein
MPSGVEREKEVARRLQFDGLYLAEQPEDDDIKVPQRVMSAGGERLAERGQHQERKGEQREERRRRGVRASRQKGLLHRVHHLHGDADYAITENAIKR